MSPLRQRLIDDMNMRRFSRARADRAGDGGVHVGHHRPHPP
jgi:hypothetical protein